MSSHTGLSDNYDVGATTLYADDTIIMAESEQDLQVVFDATFSYCKLWNMELNTSKPR